MYVSKTTKRKDGFDKAVLALPPRRGPATIPFRIPGRTSYAPTWIVYLIQHGRVVGHVNCYDERDLENIHKSAQERQAMCITQKHAGDEPTGNAITEDARIISRIGDNFW